jgi:hypothetical protein
MSIRKTDRDIRRKERERCRECNAPLDDGEFSLCRCCAEECDAEADARIAEYEEMPTCSCPYCMCRERVADGGMCSMCRIHAHQG